MRFWMICCAAVALVSIAAPSWARLPAPPTESELLDIVRGVQLHAAGHTTPDTRARIEGYIAGCTGDPERLNNHAGVLLVARGYPWEALWVLCRAALPECRHPDVLSNIGFVLAFVDRHRNAEQVLLFAVNRWPEFSPAWTNLARVYLDAGQYERAQEALDGADDAEPGTTVAEEARARMAIQQHNTTAAADALVSLSSIDPTNPMIPDLRGMVSDEELVAELQQRVTDVRMPGHYTQLPEIIAAYEEFVIDELNRGVWEAALQSSLAATTTLRYQGWTMTQEVWDQLPADIRATLAAQGVTPGMPLQVPRPAESRTHYPMLALQLQSYQDRYMQQLRDLYESGPVQAIFETQYRQLQQYQQQYTDSVRAGADPLAAKERWIAQSLNALNDAHPAWLEAMEQVRTEANRVTLRHWMSMAGAITVLPEHYRRGEIDYLLMVAAHSNMRHTGEVVKWYSIGKMQVAADREMAGIMAAELHAAAAARAWEAHCERLGWQRDFDWGLEDGQRLPLPESEWRGLDAGVFSVKFVDGQVTISGGEGLVGDVWFNWHRMEIEMGLGAGVAGPFPGIGMSARGMGVVRLGGPVGAGIGFRRNVQAHYGTFVHGHDLDIVNSYNWLVTAGRPDR